MELSQILSCEIDLKRGREVRHKGNNIDNRVSLSIVHLYVYFYTEDVGQLFFMPSFQKRAKKAKFITNLE